LGGRTGRRDMERDTTMREDTVVCLQMFLAAIIIGVVGIFVGSFLYIVIFG
jgi:hypothetical protein